MPRIIVTDVLTGAVETAPAPAHAVGAKQAKKRRRDGDAAAAPPAADAAAATAEVVTQPRKRKAEPPPAKRKPLPPAAAAAAAPPPPSRKQRAASGADRPDLAALPAEEQASALWESYKAECGGSFLEQEAFAAEHVAVLPPGPSLQGRLKAGTPDWRDTLARPPSGAPPGAPSVLVIAGAALRVLELLKELPEFNRGCRVAKLFSKHIKPEEQAQLLASGPVCIGVGTPARLDKLVAMGALSLARLRLVVLDSARDAKLRNLLDIPETRRDTWQLWRTHLAPRVAAGHTRFALV